MWLISHAFLALFLESRRKKPLPTKVYCPLLANSVMINLVSVRSPTATALAVAAKRIAATLTTEGRAQGAIETTVE